MKKKISSQRKRVGRQKLPMKASDIGGSLSEIFSFYNVEIERSEETNWSSLNKTESGMNHSSTVPDEFLQLLLKIVRPCTVTRTKALNKIPRSINSLLPYTDCSQSVNEFIRVYSCSALYDLDVELRSLFHQVLSQLLLGLQRHCPSLIKISLPLFFPVLWCSCYDTCARTAHSAKTALSVLVPPDQIYNTLKVLQLCRSELVNFLLTLFCWTEDLFYENGLLYVDPLQCTPAAKRDRYQEVISIGLCALKNLVELLFHEPYSLTDWTSSFTVFFSDTFCLHRFFDKTQYEPKVILQAAHLISSMCKLYKMGQETNPDYNLKLPFTSADLFLDFAVACLSLFRTQFSDILTAVPSLFMSFVQLYPDVFLLCKNTTSTRSLQITCRKIFGELTEIVRHNGYAVFNNQEIQFYDQLPLLLEFFPPHELVSDNGTFFFRTLFICLLSTWQIKKNHKGRRLSIPNGLPVLRCYYSLMVMALNWVSTNQSVLQLQNEIVSLWFWLPLELYERCFLFSNQPSSSVNLTQRLDSNVYCEKREIATPGGLFLSFSGFKEVPFCSVFHWLVETQFDSLTLWRCKLLEEMNTVLHTCVTEWLIEYQEALDDFYFATAFKFVDFVLFVEGELQHNDLIHSLLLNVVETFLKKWFYFFQTWSESLSLGLKSLCLPSANAILARLPPQFGLVLDWSAISPSISCNAGNSFVICFFHSYLGAYLRRLLQQMNNSDKETAEDNLLIMDYVEHFVELIQHLLRLDIRQKELSANFEISLYQVLFQMEQDGQLPNELHQRVIYRFILMFFYLCLTSHQTDLPHISSVKESLYSLWNDFIEIVSDSLTACHNSHLPVDLVVCFENIIYPKALEKMSDFAFYITWRHEALLRLYPIARCDRCSALHIMLFNIFFNATENLLNEFSLPKYHGDRCLSHLSVSLFQMCCRDWKLQTINNTDLCDVKTQIIKSTAEQLSKRSFEVYKATMLCLSHNDSLGFSKALRQHNFFLFEQATQPNVLQGTFRTWSRAAQRLSCMVVEEYSLKNETQLYSSEESKCIWALGFVFFCRHIPTTLHEMLLFSEPFEKACYSVITLGCCLVDWFEAEQFFYQEGPLMRDGLMESGQTKLTCTNFYLNELISTDMLLPFIVLIWTSLLFLQLLQHFASQTFSSQLKQHKTLSFALQRVLSVYFFTLPDQEEKKTDSVNQLLQLVAYNTQRGCQRASWNEQEKWVFFHLFIGFFNIMYSLKSCESSMYDTLNKTLYQIWTCVLQECLHQDLQDLVQAFTLAHGEYPGLIEIMAQASTFWLISRGQHGSTENVDALICEEYHENPQRLESEGNTSSDEYCLSQHISTQLLARIAWSLSHLSRDFAEFDDTVIEHLHSLKIFLPILTCLTAIQENIIYDETLVESLLLVVEHLISLCQKQSLQTCHVLKALPNEFFPFLEIAMEYLSYPQIVHRIVYDSTLLSSCLFVLSHSFSLHTQWLQENRTAANPLFLPKSLDCLACCFMFFKTHSQNVVFESLAAAFRAVVFNIEAVLSSSSLRSFCQPLDYYRFNSALQNVCSSLESFLIEVLNLTSIVQSSVSTSSPYLSDLSELMALATRIALLWNQLPQLQNRVWEFLFVTPYPWWTLPILQQSISISSFSSSSSSSCELSHTEESNSEFLNNIQQDNWSTSEIVAHIKDHCVKLFTSTDVENPLDESETSDESLQKSLFTLFKCLFLHLGEQLADELMLCPQFLTQALLQLTHSRQDSTVHELQTLSWKQLKRHFSTWLLILRHIQRQNSGCAEADQKQENTISLLDTPFRLIKGPLKWHQDLDMLLCQLPQFKTPWKPVSKMTQTKSFHCLHCFTPESLLHGLVDLISVVVLAEDSISTLFPCQASEYRTLGHYLFQTQYPCLDQVSQDLLPYLMSWENKKIQLERLVNLKDIQLFPDFNDCDLEKGCQMIENLWNASSQQYLDHVAVQYMDYPETWHTVWIMAIQLLYLISELFPAALRFYLSPQQSLWMRPKQINALNNVFKNIISPCLILRDAASVRNLTKNEHDRISVSIQFNKILRELRLHFAEETDAVSLTISVIFPEIYPLRCAELKYFQSVGVTQGKVENWLVAAKQILLGGRRKILKQSRVKNLNDTSESTSAYIPELRNSSLLACLIFFKQNAAAFLSGLEDCYICYSIVHPRTRSLPKRKCVTCKNKFHAECLDRWFKTSLKHHCPLCQSDFF